MEIKRILIAAAALILTCGCNGGKEEEDTRWKGMDAETRQKYFVNIFAYNMMSTYYLWNEEIKPQLGNWSVTEDPVAKVKALRYKDEMGREVDRWTQVTDDFESFQGKVTGDTKSLGMDFTLFYSDSEKKYVVVVVNYTYPGSPAEEAGLRRGDKIVALNGELITPDNYKDLIQSTLLGGGNVTLTMADESEKTLTAREMYLDPVNSYKIIEKDGKRIAYLHFTGFTLKCCDRLVEVFKYFKREAVSELILDLRYNGGGYAFTAEVLASMIVPEKEINNSSVFQREIYNSILADAWGDTKSIFRTEFQLEEGEEKMTVSTAGANLNINKFYVIMTGGTASASESLVCGLMPYMDVTIVGQKSLGKYCGGFIVDGPTWYGWAKDDISTEQYETAVQDVRNWGIYVMVSRYADVYGNTPCMPDGFTPDLEVTDDPLDGFQLGDENETMLYTVLHGSAPAKTARRSGGKSLSALEEQMPRPSVMILPARR